jgi:hypothetical protein
MEDKALEPAPGQTIAQLVAQLATQYGVTSTRTALDDWADTVTRLSGDEVTLDDTCQLLVSLRRLRVVSARQMAQLSTQHLRERRDATTSGGST